MAFEKEFNGLIRLCLEHEISEHVNQVRTLPSSIDQKGDFMMITNWGGDPSMSPF